MLIRIAFRNLLAHRMQTLVVGAIVFFGSLLSVMGNSVLESISDGIRRSITKSIAGDLQIYSNQKKEVKFSVFGDESNDFPDIGAIENFPKVKETILREIPEVKHVVPQGMNMAMMNPNNILDRKLQELREATQLGGPNREELKEHIRSIITSVRATYEKNVEGFLRLSAEAKRESREAMEKALSPEFWSAFDSHSEPSLEFLENKIAPLIVDDSLMFFFYVGSDPALMMKAFPLIEMVEGSPIPEGERGFLVNEYVFENQIKHRVATRLDQIRRKRNEEGALISKSKELQDKITAGALQALDIVDQVAPPKRLLLAAELRQFLRSEKDDLLALMTEFLTMTDATFDARYAFFYERIAPHIILYRVKIGDTLTLKAYTKSGSATATNMKVYGVFRFKGIERSPVSGYFSVMDLMSFRQLYGHQTAEQQKESRDLEKEMLQKMGGTGTDKESLEAMFSQKVDVAEQAVQTRDWEATVRGKQRTSTNQSDNKYSPTDLESGVVPNAAIVLEHPGALPAVLAKLEKLIAKENWNLQASPWIEVAGILGQVATVFRIILFLFIGVVYFIAIFIIMNAVLMSTMERTREIGTIRAIGAQRSFVRRMILVEVLVLCLVFSGGGIITAGLLVGWLGRVGIPAPADTFEFIFSGPRLHLSFSLLNAGISFSVAVGICLLAALYPIAKAISVPPIVAMQRES